MTSVVHLAAFDGATPMLLGPLVLRHAMRWSGICPVISAFHSLIGRASGCSSMALRLAVCAAVMGLSCRMRKLRPAVP